MNKPRSFHDQIRYQDTFRLSAAVHECSSRTFHWQHHCFRLFFSSFSGVTTCTDHSEPEKATGKYPLSRFIVPSTARSSHCCLQFPVPTNTHRSTLSETTQWWLIPCNVLHNHRSGNWLWSATRGQCSTPSPWFKIDTTWSDGILQLVL